MEKPLKTLERQQIVGLYAEKVRWCPWCSWEKFNYLHSRENLVSYISALLSAPEIMCLETRSGYRRRCWGRKPLETLSYLIKDPRFVIAKFPLWHNTRTQKGGEVLYTSLSSVLWAILLNHVKSLTLSHCPWSTHFSTHINLSFFADRGSPRHKSLLPFFSLITAH